MKLTTVLSIVAVLVATPACAASPAEKLCSTVGEIAYMTAVSRDAGEPLDQAVHEFNHGFNQSFNRGSRPSATEKTYSRKWLRFYDELIHAVYAESDETAQQCRDEAYGSCVKELAARAASDPDRDLAPNNSKDDADADQSL